MYGGWSGCPWGHVPVTRTMSFSSKPTSASKLSRGCVAHLVTQMSVSYAPEIETAHITISYHIVNLQLVLVPDSMYGVSYYVRPAYLAQRAA